MYLLRGLVLNSGAIADLEFEASFAQSGNPKPLLFVGPNGVGKSGVLALVADAFIELAAQHYTNIMPHEGSARSYFRVQSSKNVRTGAAFELALLDFAHDGQQVLYKSRTGKIPSSLNDVRISRLTGSSGWAEGANEKSVTASAALVQSVFSSGVYLFLPTERNEAPHWLNVLPNDKDPRISLAARFGNKLTRTIIAESVREDVKSWIVDIMLDANVSPSDLHSATTIEEAKQLALKSHFMQFRLKQLNDIIRIILNDPEVSISRTNRGFRDRRIVVAKNGAVLLPTLDNLSTGQSSLFMIFAAILMWGDDAGVDTKLEEISGIAVIDEIDKNLHAYLQFEALPKLISMFPKVQFIASAHAPLFVMGMEAVFGDDGYDLLELPSGTTITAERYKEFGASFAYYQKTKAFDQSIQSLSSASEKPLIVCEGETDTSYVNAAIKALEVAGLADVEVTWVGENSPQGATGGGTSNMKSAIKLLKANPQFLKRKTVFLFDADEKVNDEGDDQLWIRSWPNNPSNTKRTGGIENLLPEGIITDEFYESKVIKKSGGDSVTTETLNKQSLCAHVCSEPLAVEHFLLLKPKLSEISDLLADQSAVKTAL